MSNPNVSILALANGQTLIAEVQVVQDEKTGEVAVNLVNPCAITQSEPTDDGLVNASFTPIATLCANQTVQVNAQLIVYSAAPEDGFMQVYLQRFQKASEILTPPEKKLIVPGA
jgi:hypothetical protein